MSDPTAMVVGVLTANLSEKCYLSQALLKAIEKDFENDEPEDPAHNAEKSDIFSLGVVLLEAAELEYNF